MTGHPDAPYFGALRPKRDPLTWMRWARCGSGLFGDRGCGLVTRWVYMSGGRRAWPRFAICPVCGRRALFAFWKMKTDHDYCPSKQQEADVRALYADLKRMAQGKDPVHEVSWHELIRLHCADGTAETIVRGLIAAGRPA